MNHRLSCHLNGTFDDDGLDDRFASDFNLPFNDDSFNDGDLNLPLDDDSLDDRLSAASDQCNSRGQRSYRDRSQPHRRGPLL